MAAGTPGMIALLGSGETAPTSGVTYDMVVGGRAAPLSIAVLETPAGFEPNAAQVAGRVVDFLQVRLQNYRPQITSVAARKRGTANSPDDPAYLPPIAAADLLFLGPGSPTYAARQLRDSLVWHALTAKHRMGAAIATASAATIALSKYALPVYEIFKVGDDLHWQQGLDFFGPYGLDLVFVPHWNNNEGGSELDTSRCYLGKNRFHQLLELLPRGLRVVGIDEHTALIVELAGGVCHVRGRGGVTICADTGDQVIERNSSFGLDLLGDVRMPEAEAGLPPAIWQAVEDAAHTSDDEQELDPAVLTLAERRQQARAQRDWQAADRIRDEMAALGWQVRDTPQGPQIERIGS